MTPVWDADVEVDEGLSRELIESQFPQLAPIRLRALGVGWDNVAWLVNDAWVFRLPRREVGSQLTANELKFLPRLAPHLSLPIPVPELVGAPQGDYPYAFWGYRKLAGETACSVALGDAERLELAEPLAHFLARLHSTRLSTPSGESDLEGTPGDDFGRTNLDRRKRMMLERLERNRSRLGAIRPEAVRALAEELARTPPRTGSARWVHGDLYARHLLLDERKQLCGVIDWGDVHCGDPALDLAIAWSFLPARARSRFREVYEASGGPHDGEGVGGVAQTIDPDSWRRARFNAIHYAMVLMDYGADVEDASLERVGRHALEFAFDP